MTVYNSNWVKVSDDNQKMVVLPNATPGTYYVRVYPEGAGGDYRLLIGELTSGGDIWSERSGRVSPANQPGVHGINFLLYGNLQSNLISLARQRLYEARNQAEILDLPEEVALPALIEIRIRETEQLQKNVSERNLEQTIASVLRLEEQIKNIPILTQIEESKRDKILGLIREARDYLTQVEELL